MTIKILNDRGLEHDVLLAVLDYDPLTGIFVWKKMLSRRAMPGKIAGSVRKGAGYVTIAVQKNLYYAHRLAWFYVNGVWPDGILDHIDRNPNNNAIANLRIVNNYQSSINKGVRRTSTVGLKGVWRTKGGRFCAYIGPATGRKRLGLFDTAEEAHAVYVEAARKMHGEYSAV